MIRLFKKYPGLTVLVLVITTQLAWFWAAPGNFKMIWSKNPAVAAIIKEHDFVEEKNKRVTISYYLPYFQYFSDIVAGAQPPKKEWMESYYLGKPYIFHTYYQKAADLYPENATVHYFLGFCEYYMENHDVARAQFERSVELDPYFFWAYYDLAVIYYQQGDFYKCVKSLTQAISLRKEIGLTIMRQDFLYQQIWRYVANPSQVLGSNLDQGQKDAMLLLSICFVKAGAYPQALKMMQYSGLNSPWHQELSADILKKIENKQRATDDIDGLIQEQIPVRLF